MRTQAVATLTDPSGGVFWDRRRMGQESPKPVDDVARGRIVDFSLVNRICIQCLAIAHPISVGMTRKPVAEAVDPGPGI